MLYVTGEQALNCPCDLETGGDWHRGCMNWQRLDLMDTETAFYGGYGVSKRTDVPEHEGENIYVADTLRALLDMLFRGQYGLAQGAKEDFICNDSYTDEFFSKVFELRGQENWQDIDKFMEREWRLEWVRWKGKRITE